MIKTGLLSLAFSLTLLVGCSGSKNITNEKEIESSIAFVNPYYQEVFPGQQDGVKSMILYFPSNDTAPEYKPDSVYFKGYQEVLTTYKNPQGQGFRTNVEMKENAVVVNPPQPLSENEALVLVVYPDGKKRYIKVGKLTKRESIFMP